MVLRDLFYPTFNPTLTMRTIVRVELNRCAGRGSLIKIQAHLKTCLCYILSFNCVFYHFIESFYPINVTLLFSDAQRQSPTAATRLKIKNKKDANVNMGGLRIIKRGRLCIAIDSGFACLNNNDL